MGSLAAAQFASQDLAHIGFGQLVAELIVDGAARSMDIQALRPTRFAEGAPIRATEFL